MMQQYDGYASQYHIEDVEKLDDNDSHRIILEFLGESGSVLDVGCSTGFLGRYLKPRGRRTVGIEYDAEAAAQASPHYDRVIIGDITSSEILAQLEDGVFDAIVLGDVIEHLLDPWRAVKDIVDKLADQGSLIVSIPHFGHASVIAALLSETFQYQQTGLLDRTHYRFFSLQSLCSLIVDAGMTPVDLKRVMHNSFRTEIPIAADRLPAELFPVLDRCPESRTYQFVLKAIKRPPTKPSSVYADKFLLPITSAPENDEILQSYLIELETCRKEIREARDYIAVCTKTIKEKDDGIDHLKKTLAREQEEKERLLYPFEASGKFLEVEGDTRARARIEKRLNDLRARLEHETHLPDSLLRCDIPHDVLIPIYNAFDHVKSCVESVLGNTDPIHHVYLLDDASTDVRILRLLHSFAERDPRVHVLTSERNLGFVENVNRGLTLSRNSVVILNSDTEVTEQWLDRMHRCHCSGPRVGIVCPLSNNATILSVPVMNVANQLPAKMTPGRFASLIARCSHRVYRRIPTAVGFCMLIARRVIDQVGHFDTAFGLGYGEENDFCERAKQQGFEILCCDDAYVHHYGEASFSAVSQINNRRSQNMKLLSKRWPQFNEEILGFCRCNPLRDVQERILHEMRSEGGDNRPSILHVIHNFNAPGGTELHTRDIIDGLASQFNSTVMFPASQPSLWNDLSFEEPAAHLRIVKVVKENEAAREFFFGYAADLSSSVIEENFARFVSGGGFSLVHFQHLLGWDTLMLPFVAKELGKKVVISLHDYYLLCPEYNLILPGSRQRCGKSKAEGSDAECLYCLGVKRHSTVLKSPMSLPGYIAERFAIIRGIFGISDAIIAPSIFVRDRFVSVFGGAFAEKCVVIPHGVETLKKSPRPERRKKLRVGFLGNANDRKGIMVYLAAAQALRKAEIQFEIFGNTPAGLNKVMSELGVIEHGGYRRTELPVLLSKIDLVVVPSVWDETFCLTVSEAQVMGVPVLASDGGAICERIREGKTGFLFPLGDSEALASRLHALSVDMHSLEPVMAGLALHSEKTMDENVKDYNQLYSCLTGAKSLAASEGASGPVRCTMSQGKVSIVILTYNQLGYTKECIASIRKHTPQPHEIVFVDNGSTDGTVKWLRKRAKNNSHYKLVENKKNLGFSKGCNQGIEASSGEYILLLNNDVIVTENWLAGMLECINSAHDLAIVGPMTNSISGPQNVPVIGYSSIEGLAAYARAFRERNRHRRIPQRRVVGFCMLFRRQLIEEVGLLDERFGSGNFEDDDLCLRASLAGYRNMIAGDVFIHHYGSRTFIGNKIDYGSALSGNRKIFTEKWSGKDVAERFGKKLLVENAVARADDFHHQGHIEKAAASMLEAIKLSPDDRNMYLNLADMLIDAKRYEDARSLLESMAKGDSDARQLALLGYCEESLGRDDKAQDYVDRALAIEPSNVQALNTKGVLAYKKSEKADAETLFKKAIDANPSCGESYTNLGSLKWEVGDREEGLNLFERGFILSPTTADVAAAYHSAAAELALFERADSVFREAQALFSNDKRITFLMISLLIQNEKNDAAISEIEKAMMRFGIDDGILSDALEIRAKIGPREIQSGSTGRSLSVCMIVKNEELNLAKCLMSVKPVAGEIIVVDTGSTDKTKAIASALGARVFDFPWTHDFSEARNYSLSQASGDWILVLDADEIISPLDHALLRSLINKADGCFAYSMTTRNYTDQAAFQNWTANSGKYLQEEAASGWLPSPKVRLFVNDSRIRFVNPVHELVEPTLKENGIRIKSCSIPVHHYGRLNQDRVVAKGEEYYRLGKKKVQETKGDYNALKELAIQASEIGRYEESLPLWESILKLNPKDAEAYLNLGYALIRLSRYDQALMCSIKALELDPKSMEAGLNYAGCELIIGDVRKAIAALDKIVQKNPDYPPALARLGAALIIDGQREAGLKCLERLRQIRFDCAGALSEHARAFLSQNRFEQATMLMEVAVETRNVNTDTRSLLAECRLRRESLVPLEVTGASGAPSREPTSEQHL